MTILRKAALATIGSIMVSCSPPQPSLGEIKGITVTENFVCFSNRCNKLWPQELRDHGFQYCDPPPALAEPADFTLYQQDIRSTELCDGEMDQDKLHFWNTLAAYVPLSGFGPQHDQLKIVDVGCGDARSAFPLIDYFTLSAPKEVNYVGVDISASVIDNAKAVNRARPELQFLVADARDFLQFTEPGKSWDVILIRHQEVGGNIDVWREIFHQSLDHLAPRGIVIVTSYFCPEHLMMKTIFREELKARVYVAGENVFSDLQDGIHVRDHYIAIFGK